MKRCDLHLGQIIFFLLEGNSNPIKISLSDSLLKINKWIVARVVVVTTIEKHLRLKLTKEEYRLRPLKQN